MKEQPRDWINELEKDKIDAGTRVRLDELLSSPAQASIKAIVKSLPEDTVSLQWRSALNERLLALEPVKKKLSLWIIGARALAGFGVAGLIAVALMVSHRPDRVATAATVDPNTFASALISEHSQTVISSEIAGSGIVGGESDRSGDTGFDSSSNTDSDSL